MPTFPTSSEAKEYLVNSILAEAQRQGVSLSEVEQQMLSFSAVTPTDIASMNLYEEFDRNDNAAEYEQKIAGLIRSLRMNDKTSNREAFDTWTEAARAISKEDHYLLVMIEAAGAKPRPPYDQLKLLATALLIVGVLVAIMLLKAGFI